MLDCSSGLFVLDLLYPLCPRVLKEVAHYALDLVAILLQCIKELLFLLKSVSFVGLLDVLFIVFIVIIFSDVSCGLGRIND